MAKASPVVGHHGQDSEPEVKNVQIFSNGDRFAPGRHVVLNTRQIRNFETFLDELTRILNPLHGAIRRLYTPVNGTPVEDTKDLREGAGYVAAGKEKFKKLSYYEIQPLSPRRGKGPKFPYFDIKPVTHSQFRVSGKVKKINIQNKKIVVFPNGQFFLPPSIIVLNQNDQASMDTVMHSVGIKVDLPQGGFPERLYTLDGLRVDSTEKVTNGTMYVAASHREKFKPGPYGPYMRMGQVKFPSRLTPLNKKKYSQKGSDSEQSQENSTASEYSSSKRSRKSRATTRDTENGVFHVRPVKHKRSPEKPAVRQTVDYDKAERILKDAEIETEPTEKGDKEDKETMTDVGGLFRSKNPLFDHAEVIDEMNKAEETVAEPIDHGSSLDDYIMRDGRTVNPEEDKSKNDYTGVPKDTLISVPIQYDVSETASLVQDNIPPVSAEGTNVDEEPVFKEGSSKPAKGPTPEKAEIQVPTPEPKDDVAASPKEEARPIETAKTEEAPIKEEMNHPSIEVMNKSTRDKISESFPGQISSEQLNDFPKDQLNELNNNVQYDKPVSEPCKEIPKEQFSELSKEQFNESPNGHFSEQLKEGFGQISVQPQDPEVNIPKVDSSKHQQQENLSDKQPKVDVNEQGKEQQVDKSLSDKYKDEESFSKQSKKESPHQSSGALHDQGSQQICDQVQPMGVDSSPRIISNDKVHQLSTDSQPKEKTDDQSKVENNEQSEAQNAKELSKPTQMPFTDQTIETKNKLSQPQLNEPLSQAEFNDSQNGKINETSSHSLFSEKDQGNMAMHHQAETPKETFGKMNESFSKIQDTGKPEEKINEPAQSQFGEKTNEKNNEKPQTDIMKQSNEKIGTSTEPHFTDQNNKKDSGLSHSQFDKKPDEKMSETSSESQFSEQAHVMMNEPQSKPFEQPQETLREALPSQFTEPFSPSPFSEKHKELSEPSSKSQCDEPPREKMSESLPQTHMAQTDEKTCKPSSQSEIPEQHNEKIDKPLSKSQFSEPPKEMSEHSNSLSNEKSQGKGNEPASQSHFSDQSSKDVCETTSQSLFTDKTDELSSPSQFGVQAHDKMNEPSSQSQIVEQPHEKMIEPQSKLGQQTHENMSEPSSQSHFGEQPHEKMSEPSSQNQFSDQPHDKMSEPSSQSQFSEQPHDKMSEPSSQSQFSEQPHDKMSEPSSQSQFSEQPHDKMSEPSSQSQFSEQPHEKMSEPSSQNQFSDHPHDKMSEPSSQPQFSEQPHDKMSEPSSQSQFSEQPHDKMSEPSSQSQFSEQPHEKMSEPSSQSQFSEQPHEKMSEPSSQSQFSEQPHEKMSEPSSQNQFSDHPHDKMSEPSSQPQFSEQPHDKMSEPSSQSQFSEQPHDKMSEPSSQPQFSEQPHDKMSEPSSQSQFSEQPHDKMSEPSSQPQFSEQPHDKMSEPSSQSQFSEQPHDKMSEPSSQPQFSEQPHDKMSEPSSQSQFSEQPHDKMSEPSSQPQFSEQPHDKMSEPSSQSQFSEQPHDKMSEPSSQSQFSEQPHEKMSEPSSQSQFSEQPHDKMSETSSQSQSQFSEQSYGNMNEPSSQSQFNEKQSHDKISEPPSQSHFSEKPNDQMSEPFSQSQFNEQPHEKMSEPLSQSQFSEPTHEKMSEPSSQSQFTRQLNDKIYEPSSQSQISEPPHEKISESSSVSQFDKQTHEKANELPSQIQYSEHSHDKDHTKFPTDLNENSQNFGKEFHEEVGQQQQQPYSQFNDPFNQISKLTQDQSHENSQTILGQEQQFTDKPCEKVMDQYEAQFPDSSKQKIGGQHEEPANNHLQQTQFNDQLTQLKEQVTQQPQVHEKVSQLPMNTYEELHKVSDLPQQDEFNKKSSGQFSDDHYQQDMGHVPEYAYQSVETPKQQSRESSPHPFSDASYDLVGDKSPLHFTDQTQNNFGQETLKQSTEEHFVQESKQQFEEPLPHNFCDKNIEKLSDQVQQQFKGIDEQLIGKENHEQTTQQSFAAFIDQPTEVINNKVHQLFSEQVIEENDVHQSHGIMVEQSKVPNNGQSQLENKNEFGNFDKDSISEQNMMTLQETAEKSNEKLKDIGMATPYDQFERSSELKDDKKAVVEDLCDFSKVQTTECLREGQRKEIIVGQPDMSNNKDKQDAFESFPMKDTLSKEEDTNKEKVNEFNQIENNNNDVKISSADLFASEIGKEVKEMVSDHSKTAGLNGLEKNDYHEMAKEVVLESQEQKNLKAAKESFDVNGLPKDNVKESSSQAIMPEQVHVMGKGDTALHESLMQSKEKDNKLEIASKDVKMSGKDESPKMDSDTTNEDKVNEKNEKSQQDDHLAEKETDKNGHQKDSVREQPNVPVTDKTQQH